PGLEGSPILFEATGIAPPTPQLVLVTQPSETARAGVEFERQPVVQLQTPAGAPFAQPDVAVTVQIVEGPGSLGGTTTRRSNADGRVSFTDLSIDGRPGKRTLLFAAPDFTPATSDEIDVRVGPPAAERTTASVENGTAGEPTTVSLRLRDEFGGDVEGAADQIRVNISGANSGTAKVADAGGGAYSATYTPTTAGTDQITIEVGGTAIPTSPLSSSVSPGPASAATTTATFARNALIFLAVGVVVRDEHGNLVGRGGDDVRIQFSDGAPIPLTDEGDGSYTGNFAAGFSTQIVTVYVNGVPIAGSPFTA
ncbi:MAG TPA: filamin/ABP280 repeat domain-containing protein, partial [Gemmatimonadales bacterium]|nr:filamin/ABP280 repeat domain-containing protein [Gemmatimonadales bacterium]